MASRRKRSRTSLVGNQETPEGGNGGGDYRRRFDHIVLWVKDKPFEFGCLPVYPCAKISIPLLQKVAGYCRTKCYMKALTLGSWYRICKYKLQLKNEIGWTYFRLYNILFQQMDYLGEDLEEPGYWDERCQILKYKKYDNFGEFEVPTLRFMLFLFIQHSYRIMRKSGGPPSTPLQEYFEMSDSEAGSSFKDNNDESEDEFDELQDERREKRIIDEQAQYQFIVSNLPIIIQYLETGESPSPRMKLEIVDALDLILCATRSPQINEEFYTLMKLIQQEALVGYDSVTATVDRNLFISWVRKLIRVNPWGSSCGFLKWPVSGITTGLIDEQRNVHSRRENRIMCNKHTAPSCWYTISSVNDQVVLMNEMALHSYVRIYKCNYSFIYLVGAFTCVSIERCLNCTIFLGSVSGVVRITSCQRIIFVGIVRQLIVCETVTSHFQIHTPCSPILTGNKNTQLIFGPYTSSYPLMKFNLELAKIETKISEWETVVGIGYDGNYVNCEEQWSVVDISSIYQFSFPFKLGGPTLYNPIRIQSRYSEELERQEQSLQRWKVSSIEETNGMDEAQKDCFLAILFTRFIVSEREIISPQKYLVERGLDSEILGLHSFNNAVCPRYFASEAYKEKFQRMKSQTDAQPKSLEDVILLLISRAEDEKKDFLFPEFEMNDNESSSSLQQSKFLSLESVVESPKSPEASSLSIAPHTI